jgi:hypothetical protein
MNSRLNDLLEEYAALEHGVHKLISENCIPICELCTTCCCRSDICEEAIESPFLRLLHKRSDLESMRYGFLTETGCILDIGRPPVCYEFFCDELLAAQPDSLLRILGRLPTYAGQNALGNTHLVEIMQEEKLEHLAFQHLEKQMKECFQALEIIRSFFNDSSLPDNADRVLGRIKVDESG